MTRSALDGKVQPRAGQANSTKILMRCLHLATGLLGLLAYVATGIYLYLQLPELAQPDTAQGILYRANHVYLLFAALLNLQLGCYLSVLNLPLARGLQWFGSVLLLLVLPLLLLAFFQEPQVMAVDRPYTLPAMIAMFAGVLLHACARILARRQSR